MAKKTGLMSSLGAFSLGFAGVGASEYLSESKRQKKLHEDSDGKKGNADLGVSDWMKQTRAGKMFGDTPATPSPESTAPLPSIPDAHYNGADGGEGAVATTPIESPEPIVTDGDGLDDQEKFNSTFYGD